MRHPHILVYEHDGRLAQQLRPLCAVRGWSLGTAQRQDRYWRLLREGHPSVLVLKVGSKLEQELTLLERTHALIPAARIVAVGDVENDTLADLAWDLGASCVLLPPLPREQLPEIVRGLMEAAIADLSVNVVSSPQVEEAEQTSSPPSKSDDRAPRTSDAG